MKIDIDNLRVCDECGNVYNLGHVPEISQEYNMCKAHTEEMIKKFKEQ